MSIECYDGSLVPFDYPEYWACKDPASCTVSLLDNMSPIPPAYLTLLPSTPATVPHLGLIQFTCANGKKLTSDIDPVSDESSVTR